MSTRPLVSVEGIGRILDNLTPRRVQQLARDGVIPRPERGKYDLIGCVQGYVRYLRHRLDGRDSGPIDLHAERARLIKNQADESELKVNQLRGQLVPVEQIAGVWADLVTAFRARMLALPSTLAASVAQSTDAAEIDALLRNNINDALEELTGYEPPEWLLAAEPEPSLEDDGETSTPAPETELIGLGEPESALIE